MEFFWLTPNVIREHRHHFCSCCDNRHHINKIGITFCSATKEGEESLPLFKNTTWVVLLWTLLDLEHCAWEPSCYSPGESEIQMSFPVRRTRSNIKKSVFFCFGLMLLLGFHWSSLQTFYLLRCGEVKILHWAEQSRLLPSWLQFLYIEFCWIPFLAWREDETVLTPVW